LGCGYGVIGIVTAKTNPSTAVTAVDVNPAAVELTKRNCKLNGVEINILVSDCFEQLDCQWTTVIINPPIHAGKTVTYRMYEGAFKHLEFGGKLYVVTLKKHGAESTMAKLQSVFGNCEVLYKKKGIYVLECTKSG
jgi:16S rRNA (guanine1207-N2)-methyltransferase